MRDMIPTAAKAVQLVRYRLDKGVQPDVNMSSLQSIFEGRYQDLLKLFGEPELYGPGDKVQAEWSLQFTDTATNKKVIATIYDWKEYGTEPEHVTEWHIGGFDQQSVEAVSEYILRHA